MRTLFLLLACLMATAPMVVAQHLDSIKIESSKPNSHEDGAAKAAALHDKIHDYLQWNNEGKAVIMMEDTTIRLDTTGARFRVQMKIETHFLEYVPSLYVKYPTPTVLYQPELAPVRQYDNRIEINALNPADTFEVKILNNSLAMLGVASTDNLRTVNDDSVEFVNIATSGSRFNLCSDEPYRNQPSLCYASAFLIDRQFALTARHALQGLPMHDIRLVYGFEQTSRSGRYPDRVPAKDVFGVSAVIIKGLEDVDLALLKLSIPTNGQGVMTIDSLRGDAEGDPVYTLGFPLGLPLKLTVNASIVSFPEPGYFLAPLDTYQGNSGSPVFNMNTHNVVGILTAGMQDFVSRGDCMISNLCVDRSCKGERILELRPLWETLKTLMEKHR